MTKNDGQTSWRKEYLEMKAGLSKFQIQLLKEGPHQLAQAWLLGAMHNDYKKMKGIKDEYPEENTGQLRSSLQNWEKSIKKYNKLD